MAQIIDRRLNGKNKSVVNRQRFIRRFKKQIKQAVETAINKRSITDIEKGEKINIPNKDLSEPFLHHDKGGKRQVVHPGNKDFIRGDRIDRPEQNGGQGGGSEASNEGEGEDSFGFEISREEFLEIFFEDMELPDLVKRQITSIPNYKMQRSGYSTAGTPSNINILRSMRSATSRRIALAAPYKSKLKELEQELHEAKNSAEVDDEKIARIEKRMKTLQHKIRSIPFIDDFDLRYNHRVKKPKPSTQAVMFCLMDVSGSMDEAKKEVAKRFFILLYLFLTRTYEHIELVFIRHHTSAKEVNEQDFFYSRETGGTVVSSALELMKKIMDERYPASDWNIYAAQASDGDNWNADSPYCRDLLNKDIMPFVQYFAYVEIMPRHHQSLWEAYLEVQASHEHFAIQKIDSISEIFAVLHELFKRQTA